MPISTGLKNMIAGQLIAIQNQIAASQNGAKGILQMKRSHPAIPSANTDPSALATLRPSDQAEDIDVSMPPGMRFALEVHTYDGPKGQGWINHLTTDDGGTIYAMAIDEGPEGRGHDWIEIPSGVIQKLSAEGKKEKK